MKINLGKAIARCDGCRGRRFDFADERETLKDSPRLVCADCGRQVAYAELILQIEAEALDAAKSRLRTSRLI